LNYAPINLLSTQRLNHNLINSFVKKFNFSLRYMQKKKEDLSKLVNLKILKNKTRQKKHISNSSTKPKQNKNNNNTF